MRVLQPRDFAHWRELARALVSRSIPPDEVLWADGEENLLFEAEPPPAAPGFRLNVPREFVSLATKASLHRWPEKWNLLYSVLYRLSRGERGLLHTPTDPQIRKLHDLEGEVRRDCHKMKAFVRFRKSADEHYVAWHEPSHLIVPAVSPFFARRFNTMTWSILTPDCSAYWDQKSLRFGPGVSRSQAPQSDELEDLWKTYYANIFNPARIKLSAMAGEMPKKYWHTMPETAIIAELLAAAPQRVEKMLQDARSDRGLPEHIVPAALDQGADLEALSRLAARCQGCELCHSATQTVFGRGSEQPQMVLVGEQPGDQEDRRGEPFVGPAGQLLRRSLAQAGIDPGQIYFTNVVKHFRWEESPNSGKKRIHKRATWRQIETCKPWVLAELALVRPKVVVLLGSTALQSLVSRELLVEQVRGRRLESELAPHVLATVHPSALLRMRDSREQMVAVQRFSRELRLAMDLASMPG